MENMHEYYADVDHFNVPVLPPYEQAHVTVTLGMLMTQEIAALLDMGFPTDQYNAWDWFDGTWEWPKYSDEQDERLRMKILEHFWHRELALEPPGLWRHEFLRKMREIMPKFIPLYKILDEQPSLLGANSDYYKSRNIYSDFPQTALNGHNGDYASTGNDMEYERIRQMDILDLAERLKSYDDVDLMIINSVDSLFSSLITVSMNGF